MAFCLEVAKMIDFSQIASVSHITLITSCRSNEVKPNWMKTQQKTQQNKKTRISTELPLQSFFKSQQN